MDIISENRNPAKRQAIKYVAPTVVNGGVEIVNDDEDVASELKFWENTLIVYVIGEDISMHTMKNFMMKTWNFVLLQDFYYHEEGYFILRFKQRYNLDCSGDARNIYH